MQTLSDAIIYGTADLVKQMVDAGAEINEIDNYGYTPIVQCAIVNDVEKAKVLLAAGAKVDFDDLTGRTALHWAADNANMELCELLLSYGANPNAFTRACQPVLAMPVLRHNDPIKKLLYKHGGKLIFAQDFINGKLLGHRFELSGRVDVVDTEGVFNEIEFEGFYLEFSLALVVESLIQFKKNFGAKHLRPYFDKLQVIIDSMHGASKLIKYQHYMVDVEEYQKKIDELLEFAPLVIPVVYSGHAITFIAYGNFLIRCDRGEFGRKNGTVIIYRMERKDLLDKKFVRDLIYTRQDTHTIDEGLVETLGLQKVGTLPLSEQVSGNCSWANVEAVVPTMMFLLLLQEYRQKQVIDMRRCQDEAMYFYDEWVKWDKNRAMTFCMQTFYRVNKARKATKAAILAAILFQEFDFDNLEHRDLADKFEPILNHPDYRYIVKAYVEVFQRDRDNPRFQSLLKFVDYFEIDVTGR